MGQGCGYKGTTKSLLVMVELSVLTVVWLCKAIHVAKLDQAVHVHTYTLKGVCVQLAV